MALALITGATSGMGLGVAKALASRGCDIVINGLGSRELIDSAVQECTEAGASRGVKVHYHDADLSNPSNIASMFDFIGKNLKRSPDILVNNAGVQHVASVEDFPTDKWDWLLAVNLSAAYHTTRLAVGGMKERGWGRIINVASAHGLVASPNKSAYCASKFGIIGLTKVVALETATSGITCNAICPGWVLTPLTIPQVEAIAQEKGISFEEAKTVLVSGKHATNQFVMPNEIGALVAYLCSDEARQVTGATLSIDGGWTAI